jgi:hypothetical protein
MFYLKLNLLLLLVLPGMARSEPHENQISDQPQTAFSNLDDEFSLGDDSDVIDDEVRTEQSEVEAAEASKLSINNLNSNSQALVNPYDLHSIYPVDQTDLLLIFLADPAEVHGIERSTGSLLFKYEFLPGSDQKSSPPSLVESESFLTPGAEESVPRLVPNLDGSLLYTMDNIKFFSLVDIFVRDLVNQSPISNLPGFQNMYLVGTKSTTIHIIDTTTELSTISESAGSSVERPFFGGPEAMTQGSLEI